MMTVPEQIKNGWFFETCTCCGGIGRVPNHSHIKATACKRCEGTGMILRPPLNKPHPSTGGKGEK